VIPCCEKLIYIHLVCAQRSRSTQFVTMLLRDAYLLTPCWGNMDTWLKLNISCAS
jgi:hypothetical protein